MSASEILRRVRPTRLADVWTIEAHRHVCLGPPNAKHMSGGACVAAMVQALEDETGQPLIQACAQFLAAPSLGAQATIDVQRVQDGRSICYARAAMRTDKEAVAMMASLGARPDIGAFQWTAAPDAPLPGDCDPLKFIRADEGDLHTHLNIRVASAPSDAASGKMVFWVEAPPEEAISSAFLALIADYMPEAIHGCIGRPAGAVSLDNSIRILRRDATPWLLCQTQLSGISAGLCHGRMSIFAQDGVLLAEASQTAVVRLINANA